MSPLTRQRANRVDERYFIAYGRGAQWRAAGGGKKADNPYTYGTLEHDAWNDGFERRP